MASRSSNRAAVPEAKGALDKFKYEVANELGVPLSDGYNGDLTSKQNGSVGGYMVKKMIEQQEKQMAGKYAAYKTSRFSVSGEKRPGWTRTLFSAKIQHMKRGETG